MLVDVTGTVRSLKFFYNVNVIRWYTGKQLQLCFPVLNYWNIFLKNLYSVQFCYDHVHQLCDGDGDNPYPSQKSVGHSLTLFYKVQNNNSFYGCPV